MCGGRLSGGREGLAERLADSRIDLAPRGDDESHRPLDLAENRVERHVVGRVGDHDAYGAAFELVRKSRVAARRGFGEQVDRLVLQVVLAEVDELEALLLGDDLGELALVHELVFDEHLAEAPAGGPRCREGSIQLHRGEKPGADDQLAEGKIPLAGGRECHLTLRWKRLTDRSAETPLQAIPPSEHYPLDVTATRISPWIPVFLWAGLIFTLSSVPDLGTGLGTWNVVLRKIAHIAEYALLGALLYRATRRAPAALLLASAYAVTDEIHQTFVPSRHGTPVDWLIDTAGAAIGVAVAARVWR